MGDLTRDEAGSVFEAHGSDTARHILAALADDVATASEVADRVDTSLQNVQYHLEKLEDAELVAEVGTWYSSRGKEMTVYAPSVDRLELRLREPAPGDGSGEARAPAPGPAALEN